MGAAELPQHESHGAVLARVRAAIAHLADPEIPVVSLSELGILREVRTGADGVPEVVITPTYSGCPAMGQIEDDIVAALRDVASQPDRPGSIARPELGARVRSWHLLLSRSQVGPGVQRVRRPRHFIIYRTEPDLVVVGRLLHDAMELARHMAPDGSWL